jgi:hypothetical protein
MTIYFFDSLRKRFTVLLLCAALFTGNIATADDQIPPQAGEIILLLGKAFLEDAEGRRHVLEVGDKVSVNHRIVTAVNGHVHIRFVDQALVSVRPDSRLEILRYDYNASNPEQSSVKFNLQEGVTRAISGDAAHSARDRFRLNTPVAAIGVRGTDFVVSATETTVRALVNEGSIVMAPYSVDCAFDAFGPCLVNAVEVSDSSMQLVEFNSNSNTPRLLPAPHERDPDSLRGDVQVVLDSSTGDDGDDNSTSNEVYLEGITGSRVSVVAQNIDAPTEPGVDLPVDLPDFTPDAPLVATELTEHQLVWGRWGDGQGVNERITLPYQDVRPGREVGVWNGEYTLLRPDLESRPVDDGLGIVSFGLDSAQAFYESDSGVFAMQVNNGNLDIDFDNNRFTTSLDLNAELTGVVNFTAAGEVLEGGFFNSRSDDQRIAGAVTLDGSEAGYFFEKQLQEGGIQGLTLWGSP